MDKNPVACRRKKNTVREGAVAGLVLALELQGGVTVQVWRRGRGDLWERLAFLMGIPETGPRPSLVYQLPPAHFSHVRASLNVHLFPGSGRNKWRPRTAGSSVSGHRCTRQGDGLCVSHPLVLV